MTTTYDMDKRVTCGTCDGSGFVYCPPDGAPHSGPVGCPDCRGRGEEFAVTPNRVQRVGPLEVLREELDVYTTWSARIASGDDEAYRWVLSHNRRDGYLFAGYRGRNMIGGNMPVAPGEAESVALALLSLNADELVESLR